MKKCILLLLLAVHLNAFGQILSKIRPVNLTAQQVAYGVCRRGTETLECFTRRNCRIIIIILDEIDKNRLKLC